MAEDLNKKSAEALTLAALELRSALLMARKQLVTLGGGLDSSDEVQVSILLRIDEVMEAHRYG